jgi:hypothetical protein
MMNTGTHIPAVSKLLEKFALERRPIPKVTIPEELEGEEMKRRKCPR